ncbi:MAG: phospholipase [Polaromonas sp.]|nr:phospholipase [Polaromonas sp.]
MHTPHWATRAALLACVLAALMPFAARAQDAATPLAAAAPTPSGWQGCRLIRSDPSAQLACFQRWADGQAAADAGTAAAAATAAPAATVTSAAQPAALPELAARPRDDRPNGCRESSYSELSKFWELQRGTDCDTFSLRGYRPTTLALVASDSVNTQPSSPVAGHTALTALPYSRAETKIQLSVRTKIAKGLLKGGAQSDEDLDSLWFGYTQQSYWQLFNGNLSRPFRTTDHEPEVVYIYPHQIPLGGGWNYRLSGVGISHQSNGQSLPLSRSWNRVYLMGAGEKTLSPTSSLSVQGRMWQRLRESSGNDDNPGIENYIGRAELAGSWRINQYNTLGVTLRHSLRREAYGSTRLDWMMAPNTSPNYTGLRYHVQFFSGYGDSLLDYNRKRNVLSVGLSLVDW